MASRRPLPVEEVDFLVVGGGVAGLRAAIALAPHGSVLVVTKDIITESSTEYAQGGIAVALSDEDEVGIHFEDTIKAGDGLSDERAVRILVEEGPARIQELIEWGAEFDRDGSRLSFTLEAAHSRKRVLHAQGDSTGKELVRVLVNKVKALPSVRRYTFTMLVDLIIDAPGGRCIGAVVIRGRELLAIKARATVLATGGAGQVYSVTTNPQVATADGMGAAIRAGAEMRHMEFVQFHPTSLFLPDAPHFLLTEAMRGEGARLRNVRGELFMDRYHRDAELAPRDVVSRALISEMVETHSDHALLDLRHLDAGFVRRRFPTIYETCRRYGLDITAEPVPVCPAMHYMMGGVRTGTDGATGIAGLYAAGEVACTGIHGANRLASNSLLEGLVYGARTGAAAAAEGMPAGAPEVPYPAPFTITAHDEIRGGLRKLMWEKVGIIRCAKSLGEAMDALDAWRYILAHPYQSRRELELRNMIQTAFAITEAAMQRKESVGAHYRSDYKNRSACR